MTLRRPARRLLRALLPALAAAWTLAAVADALPGRAMILVATPQLTDPTFAQTIVLVTRHGRSPPIGVILNRPTAVDLNQVFPSLDTPAPDKLFFGGPVDRGLLVYLFRGDAAAPSPDGAIELAPSLFLSRTPTLLAELLRGARAHHGLRVFGGFAGWAPGQLEREIERGDWQLLRVDEVPLFDRPPESLWPELSGRTQQRAARARNPVRAPLPDFPTPSLTPL